MRSTYSRTAVGHKSESGQIIVEYVLLMVVAVLVAVTFSTVMVNRSVNNPGFLIAKWTLIIQTIGADTADDL